MTSEKDAQRGRAETVAAIRRAMEQAERRIRKKHGTHGEGGKLRAIIPRMRIVAVVAAMAASCIPGRQRYLNRIEFEEPFRVADC